MPMPLAFGSAQVTFFPPIQICPLLTSTRPAIPLSRVDLPQPEGPSRTMNSPSSISIDSFSMTETPPNSTAMFLTDTALTVSSLYGAGGDTAHEPAT